MLNASKIKEFQEQAQAAIPTIQQNFTVVSDDDMALFTREVKSSDNQVVLVGVLPSYGLKFNDKDNYQHSNKMMFFVVKKFDIKKSNEEFLAVYDQTAAVVLKLEKWLFQESEKFPCNPLFKEIDFRSFSPDPVRDYHGFNGYMINFELFTNG